MMKKYAIGLMALLGLIATGSPVLAHCEVPCGIYDDQARINEMHEDVSTIEKAMIQVKELSAEGDKNYNQIVRWITTKEEHAKNIQHLAQQYFLTQRIKPKPMDDEAGYKKYIEELKLLHGILIEAMKCKQTLDTTHVAALHDHLEKFAASYFDLEKKKDDSKKK